MSCTEFCHCTVCRSKLIARYVPDSRPYNTKVSCYELIFLTALNDIQGPVVLTADTVRKLFQDNDELKLKVKELEAMVRHMAERSSVEKDFEKLADQAVKK